jgi:hypothetical protein
MAVREVAFELECFEWADERLELAGRWKGLAGRRLARPVLSIDTGTGRRKRLVALPGGHLGAAEDDWRATFEWPGDPGEIIAAELEVGGSVVVDLPLPDRRRRRRKRAAPDPGDELLRNEVAALRAQVDRLRAELAGRERENMQLSAQLDEGAADRPEAVAGADAPTVEIERLASERQELTAEVERLAGERDQTRAELVADVERLQGERDAATEQLVQQRAAHEHARELIDDLRQAIADAAAEAEEARDRQGAELAALQADLDAERAQSARLRVELAERPPLPPPATVSGRRTAAAPAPPAVQELTEGDTDDATQPGPVLLEAASLPGALDPPGPLRAGARPAAQPGGGVRMPGWLRSRSGTADLEEDDDPTVELGATAATAANGTHGPARAVSLQALRSRLEQLFASNGHAAATGDAVATPREEALPGPRRTATAARARAGASFAARRSQTEVWGLRILAVALVAMLLLAFVLILLSIA